MNFKMKERKIVVGEELESNTKYYATEKRYDIYLSDTVFVQNNTYTCCTDRSKKDSNEMNIAFLVKQKENVILDFKGATVYLHGKIQPFLLDGCKNVTVKNCVVEYDRSFVSEAEIFESTSKYIKVKMREKFSYRIEDGDLIITSETWENNNLDKAPMFFQLFDKSTRRGAGMIRAVVGKNPQIGNKPYDRNAFKLYARQEGEYIFFDGENLPIFEPNLVLVIAHADRKYSSFMMLDCENIYLENYRILNGAGMGILPIYTKNIYIDGLKLYYDEHSHGIISNEADAIHAVACSGDFILKNSIIEGMVDDALNIHGNFYQVISCKGNKLVALCAGAVSVDYKVFGLGDTICIYEGATLNKSAEYIICGINRLSRTELEITVDRELSSHAKGDTIENLSAQAEVQISNCRFGKANTHLRFQSRGKIVVEDCETELPFLLTGDMSFWFESSPVCDMTIQNTKFKTPNAIVQCIPEFAPTDEEEYYHKNLTVKNCEFEADIPLRANYTKCIVFERNSCTSHKNMRLILNNCGESYSDCETERHYKEKKGLGIN